VFVPPSKLTDRAFTGYDLDTTVPAADIVKAIEIVDRAGFTIDCITGVDWIDAKEMEVVYDFFHTSNGKRIVVRSRIPREKPEIATISHIYPGASWHERETHDFFGIVFVGHPHLVPILLEDDANYHPLRKDYPGAAPFER
jgi:NADH-quinone oxidoreductase subunit C